MPRCIPSNLCTDEKCLYEESTDRIKWSLNYIICRVTCWTPTSIDGSIQCEDLLRMVNRPPCVPRNILLFLMRTKLNIAIGHISWVWHWKVRNNHHVSLCCPLKCHEIRRLHLGTLHGSHLSPRIRERVSQVVASSWRLCPINQAGYIILAPAAKTFPKITHPLLLSLGLYHGYMLPLGHFLAWSLATAAFNWSDRTFLRRQHVCAALFTVSADPCYECWRGYRRWHSTLPRQANDVAPEQKNDFGPASLSTSSTSINIPSAVAAAGPNPRQAGLTSRCKRL